MREKLIRSEEVTVPLSGEAARPFDGLAYLEARYAAEGREVPLSKPLSPRAERFAIGVIAALVIVLTVLAFTLKTPSRTGIGWVLGGLGGAVVAALIWAHLRGGVDKAARADRPAAQEPTATVAPAVEPAVVPVSHRLAPIRARLVAGLLDQALGLLPLIVLLLVKDKHLVAKPAFTALVVFAFAIWLLAGAVAVWLTDGRTPGRRLLGIRVVSADGLRLTLRRALRRELGGMLMRDTLGLQSLASMATDDMRRSSADRRGHTLVVVDDR